MVTNYPQSFCDCLKITNVNFFLKRHVCCGSHLALLFIVFIPGPRQSSHIWVIAYLIPGRKKNMAETLNGSSEFFLEVTHVTPAYISLIITCHIAKPDTNETQNMIYFCIGTSTLPNNISIYHTIFCSKMTVPDSGILSTFQPAEKSSHSFQGHNMKITHITFQYSIGQALGTSHINLLWSIGNIVCGFFVLGYFFLVYLPHYPQNHTVLTWAPR